MMSYEFSYKTERMKLVYEECNGMLMDRGKDFKLKVWRKKHYKNDNIFQKRTITFSRAVLEPKAQADESPRR